MPFLFQTCAVCFMQDRRQHAAVEDVCAAYIPQVTSPRVRDRVRPRVVRSVLIETDLVNARTCKRNFVIPSFVLLTQHAFATISSRFPCQTFFPRTILYYPGQSQLSSLKNMFYPIRRGSGREFNDALIVVSACVGDSVSRGRQIIWRRT